MSVARHHQHVDHEHGFRRHTHDDLGPHIHHRGPDYVTYPNRTTGWDTYTGNPDEIVPDAGEAPA